MAQRKSGPSIDPEIVRKTAYEIWEEEGRPVGRDQYHWLAAEARAKAVAASMPKTALKLGDDKPAAKPKAPAKKPTAKKSAKS